MPVQVQRLLYFGVWLSLCSSGCGDNPAVRTTVAKSIECDECAIVLEPVVSLGAVSDTIWPTRFSTVTSSGDGNFYVGMSDHPGTILIYGSDGVFKSTFGRRGQGPGEYDTPIARMMRGPGESISVLDLTGSRLTVVDRSGVVLAASQLPHQLFGLAWLRAGTTVVAADVRTPELIGKPLHELSSEGEIVRSFGGAGAYRSLLDGYRILAPSASGGLWVGSANMYRVEYYDEKLEHVRTIQFDLPWFKPYTAPSGGGPERPDPMLAALWEDEEGFLWTILRVADLNWESRDPTVDIPERRASMAAQMTRYDCILEVIDPTTGERIASQRFDDWLAKSDGDGLVYSRRERPDGSVFLTLFKPHLQRRRI